VGGIALNESDKISDFGDTNVYVIRNMMLADSIKLVRSIAAQKQITVIN
jgi:hypothetical protein